MRKSDHRRDPLDCLDCERSLLLQLSPSAISSRQKLRVSRLRLRKTAFAALDSLIDLGGSATDLLVSLLKQLGQRHFDVLGNPLDFRETFAADFVDERPESSLIEPGCRLGKRCDSRKRWG